MRYEGEVKRVLMGRIPPGEDLVVGVKTFLAREGVRNGSVSIIGALRNVKMGFYDQKKAAYEDHTIADEVEILHCTGNVSMLDGETFAHLHVMVADREGHAWGGHLFEAEVFVAECIVYEFGGEPLVREKDDLTGLTLWPAIDLKK